MPTLVDIWGAKSGFRVRLRYAYYLVGYTRRSSGQGASYGTSWVAPRFVSGHYVSHRSAVNARLYSLQRDPAIRPFRSRGKCAYSHTVRGKKKVHVSDST